MYWCRNDLKITTKCLYCPKNMKLFIDRVRKKIKVRGESRKRKFSPRVWEKAEEKHIPPGVITDALVRKFHAVHDKRKKRELKKKDWIQKLETNSCWGRKKFVKGIIRRITCFTRIICEERNSRKQQRSWKKVEWNCRMINVLLSLFHQLLPTY